MQKLASPSFAGLLKKHVIHSVEWLFFIFLVLRESKKSRLPDSLCWIWKMNRGRDDLYTEKRWREAGGRISHLLSFDSYNLSLAEVEIKPRHSGYLSCLS